MEKVQYYDGLKFTRDDKTGYYLNSTIRKRIHRYVWEHERGPIPAGCHIHHIDGDKSNNDISNLECVDRRTHESYHAKKYAQENRERVIRNLDENVRPLANEWHGSVEGLEWHKRHYEEHCREVIHQKGEFVCIQCARKFAAVRVKENKFCSNACKSKWRRDNGLDDVQRICAYCGNQFMANKYSTIKFCSKNCSHKARRGTHYAVKSYQDRKSGCCACL